MKKPLCLTAVIAIVIVLTGMDTPHNPSLTDTQRQAVEKAVLETHDKIIAAAEKQDADAVFSFILDNDQVTIIQDGRLFSRRQALDAVKDGYTGTADITYIFVHRRVNVLSPTTAVLAADGTVTVTFDSGQRIETEFANTSVFVCNDQEWKIIHGHHSIPNPRF